MATVKELKAYLETIPDDTEVHVLSERTHGWDTYTSFDPMNLHQYEGNVDFNDASGSNDLYLGQR